MLIERARPDDAVDAAVLAERKRAEYERYSPVFWRAAADARERHEPFLRFCLDSDDFTGYAAREERRLRGIVIAQHRVGPPPLATDAAWLVDDFFVEDDAWEEVGGPLLGQLEAQDLVVLAARRDTAKQAFLQRRGYHRRASWWVRPVEPAPTEAATDGFDAVTGPAPPVYDPGGTTALARSLEAAAVPAYTAWAAAQGAVLAIAAARSEDGDLEAALAEAGYEAASDWLAR